MEKGAIGFSSGLEYAPGWLADMEELHEIAGVVGSCGGLYATHIRSESGEGIMDAMKEAIEIGRCANIPVQVSAFPQVRCSVQEISYYRKGAPAD